MINEQREGKEYLLMAITGIVNTGMKRGLTLRRWCLVHNVLL